MTEPPETVELVAYTKIVEAKSLSRAAAELGIPRATIGRRLARLEGRLGARLLRRTTRSLVLTDAGDAFYRHARIVLDALAAAESSVRRDGVARGDLRVSLPGTTDAGLRKLLFDFAAKHPEVRLHLNFTSQHVDLRRDGYDVAFRASLALEPGLVARTLLRMPLVAVASPAYLAAHGTPRTLKELHSHRLLLGFARGSVPQSQWPLRRGGAVHVKGVFSSNDPDVLHAAARRGLGIALLPRLLVEKSLARGSLEPLLETKIGTEARVALVYVEREFMPPALRAFLDAVTAWGLLSRNTATLRPSQAA